MVMVKTGRKPLTISRSASLSFYRSTSKTPSVIRPTSRENHSPSLQDSALTMKNTNKYSTRVSYSAMKSLINKISMSTSGNLSDSNAYSGSTVCTVLFNGTKVYCGNAGDSRAIKVAFQNTDTHHAGSGSVTRPQQKSKDLNSNKIQ